MKIKSLIVVCSGRLMDDDMMMGCCRLGEQAKGEHDEDGSEAEVHGCCSESQRRNNATILTYWLNIKTAAAENLPMVILSRECFPLN